MKYFFKRDTLLSTISVFLIMGLLSLIPLNMHVLDPIKMALSDISFNDLAFSTFKGDRANTIENNMIIVNIGNSDREDIAKLIAKLNNTSPKVIGLDILFTMPRDPHSDSVLSTVILQTPNIVLSDKINWDIKEPYQSNYFSRFSKNSGYVNFVGENRGVIRYFSPREKIGDSMHLGFATAMVKLADEGKYHSLINREKQLELINFKRDAGQFFIVEGKDILDNKVDVSGFKNKVLLMGYVTMDPNNIEDKHFTPLNEKFVGKSIPDMNGVILHANIISMILNGDYFAKIPTWLNLLIAFLLTWLFIGFILKYFIREHRWFHLVTKTVQLGLTVLFIYIGILLARHFSVLINFTATLVAIILSVDVLCFYEGFAHWLNKKYKFKTIFKSHH